MTQPAKIKKKTLQENESGCFHMPGVAKFLLNTTKYHSEKDERFLLLKYKNLVRYVGTCL